MIDFASWVVALLAARRTAAEMVARQDLLDGLVRAAGDRDETRLAAFLRELVRLKVSPAAIADIYIPGAAARLGEDWMDDKVSFAEVTLGSARMQAMLRAIGAAWTADTSESDAGVCLLLCVPPAEQHTLGALVLMGQLRRSGISVRLAIGPSDTELQAILGSMRFDGVLISVAGSTHLAKLGRFVQTIRGLGSEGLTIVIGGGILQQIENVAQLVGADAEAGDIAQALAACNLRTRDEGRMRMRA